MFFLNFNVCIGFKGIAIRHSSDWEKRPAGELKISETLLAYEHEDSETVASERDAADYAKFLGAFQNENWYIETLRQPATNYHEDVSESDVWHFKPHVGPINGLAISNEDGDHMYTCSFDGSTRMMDINKGYFEEVFVDEEDLCKSVELIAPKQLAIALHSGDVLLADCRIPPYMHHKLKLGHPRLRTVSIHPLHRDYFCTASANGYERKNTSLFSL
ncbi:unnamed protein product [Soboliphyme baturini]|uniref:Uncharacterized protein n=1 Tax=Soboliphyme baturini TaxID=241478 RepID=A0A3P8CZS5_9BILA|nr:unnamed protein product [Soboliphyme baturini]